MGKKLGSPPIFLQPHAIPAEACWNPIATKIKNIRVGSYELNIEVIEDLEQARSSILASGSKPSLGSQAQDLCPHFGVVWPAATALAEFLEEALRDLSHSMNCLELGCGLAIPSLCLARNPRIQMIASDRHAYVPAFLQRNILANRVQRLSYQSLDWRMWTDFPQKYPWTQKVPFDLIVGSDLLYEPWQPFALAYALKALLGPQGIAILADPGRRYLQTFEAALMDAGLNIRDRYTRSVGTGTGESNSRISILTVGQAL